MITRKWLGFAKSFFNVEAQHTFVITCKYYNIIYQHQISNAYNNIIIMTLCTSVPMDLDVRMKAVMILAAVIIVSQW